jgi:hypothetical protein
VQELRLEAVHTHLYPGLRGSLYGALPGAATAATCEVAFSDGSVALGSLVMESGDEGVLETGPYTTAAGTEIAAKKWRLDITEAVKGPRPFRIRAKLPLA